MAERAAADPIELVRERRIAAEPTSLALLLAGPTGVDLWPGARRRGESRGRLLVEADLTGDATDVPEGAPAQLVVRAAAPRRTPAAFLLTFGWEPDDAAQDQHPAALGGSATLSLAYEGAHETGATLRITLAGDVDEMRVHVVTAMADGFLTNLAAAAEARSRAA